MIIAVGSDKGSPGATTLAVLLVLFWSGERVVCELDPRGADLPYRLAGADGRPLSLSPSVATLAVDSRPGSASRSPSVYGQPTRLGVSVIAGETSPARFAPLASHLPGIAAGLAAWSGTVMADLGCLQPWSPVLAVARAATVVVLVSRADTEGLGHLRERVQALAAEVGGPHRLRCPVAVVVRTDGEPPRPAVERVERLLVSVGSPAPVLGALVEDRPAAAALWSGQLSKRLHRSPLVASARSVAERLRVRFPEVSEAPTPWRVDDRVPVSSGVPR